MGRDRRNENRSEHFTKMVRSTMRSEAWRALSPSAQALYPWIKLEWGGPNRNNNGKIRLSVRQAAHRVGVSINTAARAFHDLQAKGFLVVTEAAHLGVTGDAKSPTFEITELGLPHSKKVGGSMLFKGWSKGNDFPVERANANNPHGHNGKQVPIPNLDSNVIAMKTLFEPASSK